MQRALYLIFLASLSCAHSADALPPGVEAAPFEMQSDRLFITATLNGKTNCQCLLDTGSEVTLLNRARVVAPDVHPGPMELVQGSFVGMMDVSGATLQKLTLGAHSLERVPIYCVSQGKGKKLELIDMVLGMDLLGRSRFTIDFKNSRLLFWPAGSAMPKAGADVERVQLTVERGFRETGVRPRVLGKLNGKTSAQFLLDVGADTPMFVAGRDFRELGFAPAGEPSGQLQVASPTAAMTLSFYNQPWPKLELGTMLFENVDGRILAAEHAPPVTKQDLEAMYNILGTPFLKTLDALHIDMPNKCVYLDRAKKQ